jgi:hypothetical protein
VLTLTSAASLMVVLDALMVTHRAERDPGAPGCRPTAQGRLAWPGGNSTSPAQPAPKRAMPPKAQHLGTFDPSSCCLLPRRTGRVYRTVSLRARMAGNLLMS